MATLELDNMEYATDAAAQAAYVTNGYGNTGGNITTDGNYTVHTFLSGGTFTPIKSGNVDYLVVGAGGIGGPNGRGGGGGGQVLASTLAVTAQGYTITIGTSKTEFTGNNAAGGVAQRSIFSSVTAEGGREAGDPAGGTDYADGGAYGNPTGGNGTDGTTSTILDGSTDYYGGGGGGGATVNAGGGGLGGGGDGSSVGDGHLGGDNTGGGGGGAPVGWTGGMGGSGIVIIRCLTSDFPGGPLQSYSESTIKTQGSYSLKGVAAITDSLNKTLTRTAAIGDLTSVRNVSFDMYAGRTGANIKIGLVDAQATTEITPTIITANTWQKVNWDLSAVADANKNAITAVVVTTMNADAANTFYIDNFNIAQAIDVFGWVT